jgi:hypothetical protein
MLYGKGSDLIDPFLFDFPTEATSARRARRYSIDIRSFDCRAMPDAIVRNSRKLLPKKASTEAVDYRADVGVKDGGLA